MPPGKRFGARWMAQLALQPGIIRAKMGIACLRDLLCSFGAERTAVAKSLSRSANA